jgi:hypothetical protein
MRFLTRIIAPERPDLEALYRRKVRENALTFLTGPEFFSHLDFGTPGLGQVRKSVRQKKYQEAYGKLLHYYRLRQLPLFFFPQAFVEIEEEDERSVDLSEGGKKGARVKRHRGKREETVNLLLGFRQPSRSIIEEAEGICAHTLVIPGHGSVAFSSSLNWFFDFAGGSFPYASVPDLLKRLSEDRPHDRLKRCALAPTWELNKHHHLVELAKAYWLTADERFCGEFVIQVLDWMETNPFNMGVNWLDARTIAQRLISWLLAFQMFLTSEHISPAFFERFIHFLLLHGVHLWIYLKTDGESPAALAAASALYLLTYNFPELRSFNEWRPRALDALVRLVPSLFLEDGTYRERASAGHVQALQLVILPMLLCAMNGEQLPGIMRDRVEKAFEFLMFLTGPHGGTQRTGAGAFTRVWRMGHRAFDDFNGLLSLGAFFFERGDFKFVSSSEFEDLVWFLGKGGHDTFRRVPSRVPSYTSKSFPYGGHQIVRDGWERHATYLYFNSHSDRLGEFTLTDDNHLNFELILQGEPLLVESEILQGTTDVPESVNPRNVLRVRSGEKKKFKASAPRWISRDELEYLAGSVHNGYGHLREILWLKERHWLILRDVLTGEDSSDVEMYFHLFSDHELVLRGDLGCVIRCRKSRVRMHPYFPINVQCRMLKGQEGPRTPTAGARGGDLGYLLRYSARIKYPAEIVVWWGWDKEDFRNPPLEDLKAALDGAVKG